MAKLELKLKVGDAAPDFLATTQNGEEISLKQFRGRMVVLYFYPKDNTPGCTAEACSFRDNWAAVQALGAVVLGVSTDSVKTHGNFARKFELPFPLVADPDRQVVNAYGVYAEKSFMGRLSLGTHRVTFLIGPDGRIRRLWPKVSVKGHVEDVLAAIRGEQGAG
ncbi:MAG: thioredoxin-dependent thiol peroxidase [Verrucomicrobiales bacterium]|nr:thioredoxin-dependent thiol peroxidase [Verrucomicrobiales bacterium]